MKLCIQFHGKSLLIAFTRRNYFATLNPQPEKLAEKDLKLTQTKTLSFYSPGSKKFYTA